MKSRVLFIALIIFSLLSPAILLAQSSKDKIDLVALKGKTRAQLKAIFPGADTTVSDWRGWKTVYLFFNGKGKLSSLTFYPATQIPESEAEKIVTETFGITLDKSKYIKAPAVHAYRDMTGPIRTVNYLPERPMPNQPNFLVNEISIFYNIGYNE